jgi:hypothetical protein
MGLERPSAGGEGVPSRTATSILRQHPTELCRRGLCFRGKDAPTHDPSGMIGNRSRHGHVQDSPCAAQRPARPHANAETDSRRAASGSPSPDLVGAGRSLLDGGGDDQVSPGPHCQHLPGGAALITHRPLPATTTVLVRLTGEAPTPWVEAELLGVEPKEAGNYRIRLKFQRPCQDSFLMLLCPHGDT